MLYLLWRWYLQKRELMAEFSTALGKWRFNKKLTQPQAKDVLSKHIGYHIDLRTYQRWESGKGLPSKSTYILMQQLLNDGSTSQAVFAARDDMTEANFDALIDQSVARTKAKIEMRAKSKRRK